MVDRLVYNTVLSQTFSPCGNYLFAGNIYGEIAVYDLSSVFNPKNDEKVSNGAHRPRHHLQGWDGQVSSLAGSADFLLAGGTGTIIGWAWKAAAKSKDAQPSFTIQLPSNRDALEKADVNCMLINKQDNLLYAGCGDNHIYVIDLEDGKVVRSLKDHTDYIHSIDSYEKQLVSASEDGTVRLWDTRQAAVTNILKPHTNNKLARPELGKWVGAAAINDDWLICGGGPKAALWHLRSLEVTTVFPVPDLKGVHVVKYSDDRVLIGGSGPHFYQLSLKGHVYSQIPTSPTTVYSAELQDSPNKVLSIAGSSCYIDLCTNYSYRDQILTFAL